MVSTPSARICQNDDSSFAPPGRRSPIPTMAMGSLWRRSASSSLPRISRSSRIARFSGESCSCVSRPWLMNSASFQFVQVRQQQGFGFAFRHFSKLFEIFVLRRNVALGRWLLYGLEIQDALREVVGE